ncbi:MAG: hypothetical protein PHX78_07240 [bacterium]|nr:hypothetical protein [bacterium]
MSEPFFVIEVRLDEGDPRVCDYCNKFLVNEHGITEEECFSTDYGLMCKKCLGKINPLTSHQPGEDVTKEAWYLGFPAERM